MVEHLLSIVHIEPPSTLPLTYHEGDRELGLVVTFHQYKEQYLANCFTGRRKKTNLTCCMW